MAPCRMLLLALATLGASAQYGVTTTTTPCTTMTTTTPYTTTITTTPYTTTTTTTTTTATTSTTTTTTTTTTTRTTTTAPYTMATTTTPYTTTTTAIPYATATTTIPYTIASMARMAVPNGNASSAVVLAAASSPTFLMRKSCVRNDEQCGGVWQNDKDCCDANAACVWAGFRKKCKGTTTTLPPLPTPWYRQYGAGYPGPNCFADFIRTEVNVHSKQACLNKCTADVGCNFVAYNGAFNGDRRCGLYRSTCQQQVHTACGFRECYLTFQKHLPVW